MKNQKGINNNNFKHGMYCKGNKCIEKNCNVIVFKRGTRCKFHAGIQHSDKIKKTNNGNYKHGSNCIGKKCIDCGKQITVQADRYRPCAYKYRSLMMKGKMRNTNGKGFWINNMYIRSTYELIFLKYLNIKNIKWQYEPEVFDLGNTTYTPDFYLPEKNLYVEVKGYWREDAKQKFELFKKIYHKKIIIVDSKLIQKFKKEI